MPDLRFLHSVRHLFANANLNGVDSILVLRLNLSYLAPIDLNYGARSEFTPLVPEVSHSHFVAHQADPLREPVYGRYGRDWEVFVDLVFKRFKSFRLVCDAILLRVQNLFVVETILS